MKNKDMQMLERCKKAIEKSVADAGSVFAFANQFIVVPDEDSTKRAMDDAMNAVFKIEAELHAELHDEEYYFEVRKVKLEEDSTLSVHLFVNDCDLNEHGEIVYANKKCTVTWERDGQSKPQSVMAFYQIPDNAISKLDYKDVWGSYIATKVSGVSCRNIFHCAYAPDVMANAISSELDPNDWLYQALESEKVDGANYVFIGPVSGAPIVGYQIDALLEIPTSSVGVSALEAKISAHFKARWNALIDKCGGLAKTLNRYSDLTQQHSSEARADQDELREWFSREEFMIQPECIYLGDDMTLNCEYYVEVWDDVCEAQGINADVCYHSGDTSFNWTNYPIDSDATT